MAVVSHFVGGIDAPIVQIDLILVQIESDHLHAFLGEGHGNGHSYIAQSYQRQFFLLVNDFLIQFHVISSFLKEI